MDIGALADYFVLVVVGICLCVGYVLKNLIPGDKINQFIPLIMAVLGFAVNAWINDFVIVPEVILGGMISGLASTGLYEAFHNIIGTKEKPAEMTEEEVDKQIL